MRARSLTGLGLAVALWGPPSAMARELTPEEQRQVPRPDELPPPEPPPRVSRPAEPPVRTPIPVDEMLPATLYRWPGPGLLRGELRLGAFGAQPRWRARLSGRPLPELAWGIEAYQRFESPDVYGLRLTGSWRSAPGLLLEASLGREVLGRDGAEAEVTALGGGRLGPLKLFAGPSVGARLSSAPYGVGGAAALLQHGPLTLRYDYRLRWTRLRLEGASHLLQLGWTSRQGILVAAQATRARQPSDFPGRPHELREELSMVLEAPVASGIAARAETLLGRRFDSSQPRPPLSLGWELGLALSF